MLKNLADDRGNCYAPIIVEIALIALVVFDNWNNGPTLKLAWHRAMEQHGVEKSLNNLNSFQFHT